MPGHSHSVANYRDIKAVLDTFLRTEAETADYALQTRAQAVTWRSRANAYRALLRRMEEDRLGLESGHGTSLYDDIVFSVRNEIVTMRKRKVEGVLKIDGQAVDAEPDDDSAYVLPLIENAPAVNEDAFFGKPSTEEEDPLA